MPRNWLRDRIPQRAVRALCFCATMKKWRRDTPPLPGATSSTCPFRVFAVRPPRPSDRPPVQKTSQIPSGLANAMNNDDLVPETDMPNYIATLFTVSTQYSHLFRGDTEQCAMTAQSRPDLPWLTVVQGPEDDFVIGNGSSFVNVPAVGAELYSSRLPIDDSWRRLEDGELRSPRAHCASSSRKLSFSPCKTSGCIGEENHHNLAARSIIKSNCWTGLARWPKPGTCSAKGWE